MLKPVGSVLLIRVIREKAPLSGIILPEHVTTTDKIKAVVEAVGTTCMMGVKVGHEIMYKAGVTAVQVDDDLYLVPEVQIAAILNYEE